MKLKPIVLRKSKPSESDISQIKRNPIYLILDNIIDTYNIGSLFRLGDAIAVEKMYLCGNMEYPPASRIHKAAVGTENWVPWEKRDTAVEVIKELKSLRPIGPPARRGVQIISVEQDPRSIPYSLITNHLRFPAAIVCGNETEGVSKEVLDASDLIIELPMYGINHSFNVWGSTAIVAYKILEGLK
jgi:23S rRNA (guanosine2251-2'-O)-methyltransferase